MNFNYSISILIQCLLFVYWICIGYHFYRKDTKLRYDQQIKAYMNDVSNNMQAESNAKTSNKYKFNGFIQWQFRLSIWYSGFEILSLFLIWEIIH